MNVTAQEQGGRWRRLTVHGWFVVVLGAITVLVVICAVVATIMLGRTASLSEKLTERLSPARVEAAQLRNALLDQETGVRGYLLTGNREFLRPYTDGLTAERRSIARIASLVEGRSEVVTDLNAIRTAADGWRRQYAEPATAGRQAGTAVQGSATEGGKRSFDEVRARLDRLGERLEQVRSRTQTELEQVQSVRDWAFVAMLGAFLLAGVAMAVLLRRAVGRPLDDLRIASRHIASGDFDHPIPASGPADIREVSRDVDQMRNKIVRALEESHAQEVLLREQAMELRRSNGELEQFAYVASHDLQEPLRKIATFCQLLEKRYGHVLDERGAQYIHFAVDGATRMQVLINDLLSFSRVGRLYDDRKPVELEEALDKAIDDLSTAVEEAGAAFERPERLPSVVGDATMLSLLWQNLIGNAVKFRDPERPPRITITCEPADEGGWLFAVADNGIGIEADFAEKIFVIFQRLHSRETYTGTGIGLAMCRKIVENHGGRIWLDTTFTGGARILFTLPGPAHHDEGSGS
ncbi:CHASE3 domain-containing protein [Nonomuraea purpurea]|uniref:histidine kinase n=1 Tax=Nonomuraea purpurea TaxID=1849276 RepID=A0ABV8GEZ5_9ACTN